MRRKQIMKIVERPVTVAELAAELKETCNDLWAILRVIDGPEPVVIKHLHPVPSNLSRAIGAVDRIADSLITGKETIIESGFESSSH
jgi:hypothetical protein